MPKKKVNAFANYMFTLKDSFPDLTMPELQLKAGENWEKMDSEERSAYKGGKGKNSIPVTRVRYNCNGESIEEVERQQTQKRLEEVRNVEFIDNTIKLAIDSNRLLDEEFYFFSASYYVNKLNDSIYPAEIAIAKFSLLNGITDVFHMLINPGELPIGMAYTADDHSKRTHRLPLPPDTFGEKNYHKILDEILKFLEVKELSSAHVPPFYVFGDHHDDDFIAAILTLEKIADENKCNNGFRVLRAEQLLFLLNRQVLFNWSKEDQVALRSAVHAKEAMRHDKYRYSAIGCDFHNDDDSSNECALSKVQRWGYLIAENCGLDCFQKIPGQHFPVPTHVATEDFDEEDAEDKCLTESFHLLNINSKVESQSALDETPMLSSILSDYTSNRSKPRMRLFDNIKNSYDSQSNNSTLNLFQSDLSRRMSVKTDMGSSVKPLGESWIKTLVKNNLQQK